MTQGAKLQSVQTLHALRTALLKFAQAADVAMADAEGEMTRTLVWLETEQPVRWRAELRKRQEALMRAKEALRMKTIYRDSSGRPPPADEERKAVQLATRLVEQAEQKIILVRKWTLQLQKEIFSFQGTMQRMTAAVRSDIPAAAATLEQAAATLSAYIDLTAPSPPPLEPTQDISSMTQSTDDEEPPRQDNPPHDPSQD